MDLSVRQGCGRRAARLPKLRASRKRARTWSDPEWARLRHVLGAHQEPKQATSGFCVVARCDTLRITKPTGRAAHKERCLIPCWAFAARRSGILDKGQRRPGDSPFGCVRNIRAVMERQLSVCF